MCRKCSWVDWLKEIEDMEASGEYDWAEETLKGIKDWVEENEHITEKQIQAINNIEESKWK